MPNIPMSDLECRTHSQYRHIRSRMQHPYPRSPYQISNAEPRPKISMSDLACRTRAQHLCACRTVPKAPMSDLCMQDRCPTSLGMQDPWRIFGVKIRSDPRILGFGAEYIVSKGSDPSRIGNLKNPLRSAPGSSLILINTLLFFKFYYKYTLNIY